MDHKPLIAIIAAMDENRAIGLHGDMPWRLSADMKRFKKITMGYPVIMGRKTFQSLPGGPLPGRTNIVITQDPAFDPEGATVVNDPETALAACRKSTVVFIIGGGTIYRHFIDQADILYLTIIHHTYHADTWFPAYDPAQFNEIEHTVTAEDEKFPFPYTFLTLQRKNLQSIRL